jgi:enoyl-CoA hydratase/carnithine racemase
VIETIWLDNPPVNAVNGAIIEALWRGLERLDGDVRVVVLRGRGERAFSAGADIASLMSGPGEDGSPPGIQPVADLIEQASVPVVAAIHGYCLGGGLELALACDFRVAEAGAAFGLPEVRIGIVPSSGGTHRLARLVGSARAKELVLLRDRIGAEEAAAFGLVTEVVAEGGALDRALELARGLAELPPLAAAVAKQALDAMPEASREAGLLVERLAYGLLAQTADAAEAATAFTEKRPPRFEGR